LIVKYKGKEKDLTLCQICNGRAKNEYIAVPSAPSLVNWDELKICKTCAKREHGSKNKIKWETLHEKRNGK